MEYSRRGSRLWRWHRARRMSLPLARSEDSRYGAIRTTQSKLLVRFAKSCAMPINFDTWVKRRGWRQMNMIEWANYVNLCGLLRRRAQRENSGEFLERETCTGNGRSLVHWVDADGSASGARCESAHCRRSFE